MFGHTHEWRETERTMTPGVAAPNGWSIEGGTRETVERLLWGITSIVLTCATCGDKKVVEVKGRAVREGEFPFAPRRPEA